MQEIFKIFKRILILTISCFIYFCCFLLFLLFLSPLLQFIFIFFSIAISFFGLYQLILKTIGFLLVSWLIILILRNRYRLQRYALGILAGGIILYVSFLTIPEFNFFLTFNARQQIVNQYYQQNIRVEKSSLGEINYFSRSVYFTYFKAPGRWGSRVFFVYTTKQDYDTAKSLDTHRMTVKKLRENWYLSEGTYAS